MFRVQTLQRMESWSLSSFFSTSKDWKMKKPVAPTDHPTGWWQTAFYHLSHLLTHTLIKWGWLCFRSLLLSSVGTHEVFFLSFFRLFREVSRRLKTGWEVVLYLLCLAPLFELGKQPQLLQSQLPLGSYGNNSNCLLEMVDTPTTILSLSEAGVEQGWNFIGFCLPMCWSVLSFCQHPIQFSQYVFSNFKL